MWNDRGVRPKAWVAGLLFLAVSLAARAQDDFGLGRAATANEVQAWNIDVRPDFKGLPPGSGTVDRGSEIWDSRCASCHGSFAESNSVFTAIVGGTTEDDVKTGHVASLLSKTQPVRTTFMKVDTISTLWDYIHRAMPWNAPKSLKPDDVYAVLAYLLNLADIVPSDFTLSDKTIAQVQARMPNRKGMVFWPGLWRVDGKPDTHNTACMHDCDPHVAVSSSLPDYARSLNGNLAAQMRIVGPVRGVDTLQPALKGPAGENTARVEAQARATLPFLAAAGAPSVVGTPAQAGGEKTTGPAAPDGAAAAKILGLMKTNACLSCHAVDARRVGPSFVDIAKRYKDNDESLDKLMKKIRDGGSGVWGSVPMPPHPNLDEADMRSMVQWILDGAPGGKDQ
jgi:cytochrome c